MIPLPKVNAGEVLTTFTMLYNSLSLSMNATQKTIEGSIVRFILGNAQPLSQVSRVFSKNADKVAQFENNRALRDMLVDVYREVDRLYDNSDPKKDLVVLIDKLLTCHFAVLMLEEIAEKLPPEFKFERDEQGNFLNPSAQLLRLRTIIDPRPEKYPPLVKAEQYISMAQLIVEHEVNQLKTRYPDIQQTRMGAPCTYLIPTRIVDYKNIELLSFTDYKANFLPTYLKELTKLKILNLSTNITSPQEVIYHLPALKTLAAHFYPDLARLPQLDVLDFSDVISDTSPDFTHTQSLVRLRIANCQLTKLPPTLTTLTQLTYLDLSGNFIEDVENLQHLPQLEELDLSNNPQIVSYIPIGNKLKKLICDRDHLRFITFPPDQAAPLQLEHIECRENPPLTWNKTPDGITLSAFLAAHPKPLEKLS